MIISRFGMSEKCVRVINGKFFLNDSGFTLEVTSNKIKPKFLNQLLLNLQQEIYTCGRGNAQKNIDMEQFNALDIPLPPLDEQDKIIQEIEKEEKIIEDYKRKIDRSKHTIRDSIIGVRGSKLQ